MPSLFEKRAWENDWGVFNSETAEHGALINEKTIGGSQYFSVFLHCTIVHQGNQGLV
jgi:hypothetical protein